MPSHPFKSPLVSVVIPAFNAALYLAEALDSVRAQTVGNFEIIVVDDGSTDSTARVADAPDVRYLHQTRTGAGAARNAGVAMARGEYIAFLDADDLWTPFKLERQLAVLRALPPSAGPTLVYGHAQQFFSPDLDEAGRMGLRLSPEPQPATVAGTLLATLADFRALGPYSAEFVTDIAWFLSARDGGARIHTLPDVLLHRRIHGCNMSRTALQSQPDTARALKASLDRRRLLAAKAALPL